MRRLSLWMREHPMVGDSLIAALLLLADLTIFVVAIEHGAMKLWYVAMPVDLAMALPVVFRRRWPLWVAYAVLAINIPHSALELGIAGFPASAIALYSVAVYVSRKQAAYYLAAQIGVTVVQLVLRRPEGSWVALTIFSLVLAFSWVLGEFVGARQAYQAELEARLHLLETERDHAGRIAVAEERSRIARELHDVVAHAVSVIVVQADGASYAVRSNPDLAERAVETISQTGREALAELRRLLEVLRNEDGAVGPRVPQPDAASLAELADRVRQAGVPVRLVVDGSLTALPVGVSLGVYRIVQESLTNTLKHAGPGAQAEVRVSRDEGLVDVEVLDDGAGRARELVPSASLPGGNGVIGMRERANLFGGSLEVGPRPGGGWRVHARLPTRLMP